MKCTPIVLRGKGITSRRLGQIFEHERSVFARTFPWVENVWIEIWPEHFIDRPCARDLAWYDPSFLRVCVVRGILRHPEHTVRGIIRHELGHAADVNLKDAGRERRADQLAKKATGRPILYDANGLQSSSRGKPGRPKWLHQ